VSTISSPSAAPSEPPSLLQAPRHVGIAEAMRRYWYVVALCVLLLAGLGVAWGLYRAPTYTATAENVVQVLTPSAAQLPGAVSAAQDLASSQARLIDSDGVAEPLARRLDTTIGYVTDNVTATPVPSSTVIRIEADGTSEADAVRLANAAAREFAVYVNEQTRSDAEGDDVLAQYRAATNAYQRERAALQGIERAGDAASPTERLRADAAVDAAQLRRQALSAQYQTVVQSRGTAPTVKTFVVARDAASDRMPTLQIAVLGGAVAGLLIGGALATLLANRRARRHAV